MLKRIWTGLAFMTVVALAACGGGAGAPAAITVHAAADSANLVWNSATSVDVLANDSASSGGLTVSAVTAPEHGTASIVGTSIQYSPTAGYFGPDTLTYMARASDGTTANAVLNLTVTATLTLDGKVVDGPLAGAAVTVAVGNRTFSTTADGNGAYSVDITSTAPTDVVTVSAVGAGAQGQVKLRSLLGDMGSIAQLATADGVLGVDQLASTYVTNVSTALAALVEEANAGQTPATLAQLGALSIKASPIRLLDVAAAITLVADYHASLPAGVADTAALVEQPSTSAALANFLAAQAQPSGNFVAALQHVESVASLPTGAVALPTGATETLVYFGGYKRSNVVPLQVSYAPDGTAHVLSPDGAGAATWAQAGGVLTVTPVQPFDSGIATIYDPATASLVKASVQTTSFQIRQLAGTPASGIAMVLQQGLWTVLEGASIGEVIPFNATNTGAIPMAVIDPTLTTPISTSDLPSGANWAGLIAGQGASGVPDEDILSITGSGTATFARVGGQATWSLANGVLEIVYGGYEYDYHRLIPAATTGEEEWFVTTRQNGIVVTAGVQMVAKVAIGLKFSASDSLTRQWLSGIGENVLFDLFAGGTGSEVIGVPQVPPMTVPLTWSLGADGTVDIVRTSGGAIVNEHRWSLLGQRAGSILVMEDFVSGGTDNWRLNIYADTGAASP